MLRRWRVRILGQEAIGLTAPQPVIQAALLQQLLVTAALDEAAAVEHQMRSRCATIDSRCATTITVLRCIAWSSARWIACSLTESRLDVASSRIGSGAFFSSTRAIATR